MTASLPQLLVHLDATARSEDRLRVAGNIAQAHRSKVTALYAVTPAMVVLPFTAEAGASFAASLLEIDDEQRNAARQRFDKATTFGAADWAELRDFPIIGPFARQALYADLMVLGQYDHSDPLSAGVPVDFVQSLLTTSGTPALVLPYSGAPEVVGDMVVIAWKPTREAARAVRAALPFLQRARKVHLLSWGADADDGVLGSRLDIDGFLKRHGIEAARHHEGTVEPDSLGELLLSRAFDLNADMMVMGCYGHSRAREWILGGASRTVLNSMTLPVLMAH